MKRPLSPWKTFLLLLVSTSFLTACSSLATLRSLAGFAPETPDIVFSHAEPKAQVQQSSKPISQEWSPSTWVQETAQTPTERLRLPGPAQPTEPPALIVYFDNDRHHLIPSELERLRQFARSLDPERVARLEVTGHTDSNHTAEYNIGLSMRRAQTVRRWLVQFGAPDDKVSLGWHGLHRPADTNTTDEGRQRNRRVEVRVIPG
jgi:outer membrane protein OmpA-like peptidoglycan-associated protein